MKEQILIDATENERCFGGWLATKTKGFCIIQRKIYPVEQYVRTAFAPLEVAAIKTPISGMQRVFRSRPEQVWELVE
jgi:hypothetical protein